MPRSASTSDEVEVEKPSSLLPLLAGVRQHVEGDSLQRFLGIVAASAVVADEAADDIVGEGIAAATRVPDRAFLHRRERGPQGIWASLNKAVELSLELALVGGQDRGID